MSDGFGAIAVDLGASSGRCAVGRIVRDRIEFEVFHQAAHEPVDRSGRLEWDLGRLMAFPLKAIEYATAHFERATVGIDAWGVDHGFIGRDGVITENPVCYRDHSHARAMEELREHWDTFYALTGIQRQPFNTVYQLWARGREDPSLADKAEWHMLPDLLGYAVSTSRNYELTQASTTQLLGLDGNWCREIFDIIGWPLPSLPPTTPGRLLRPMSDGVNMVSVGSHDTASAVAGFGRLDASVLFVNAGTWSLVGTVVDQPIVNETARRANLTNERTVDGRVRLLKNVPGFYVLNRIHEELGCRVPLADWIAAADLTFEGRVDLMDEAFFNPASMIELCRSLASIEPRTDAQWAGLGLLSMVDAALTVPPELFALTGTRVREIRIGGGGSQSRAFCQTLANKSGLPVRAGPAEATVLGNLGAQFLAAGFVSDWDEVARLVERSANTALYEPRLSG